MADDIVERLRDYSARGAVFATNDMCWEAADEIERLRAIGKSHYGPHHDPMWCPICDSAWPCPTWIQFFGEEDRRG